MKQSQFFTRAGVIYHPITKIIGEAKKAEDANVLVIVENNEVFDEAMVTITNRFPQAIGAITTPAAGCKMPARNAEISIYFEVLGKTVKLHVVTDEVYQANKTQIDRNTYTAKHNVAWSGGLI